MKTTRKILLVSLLALLLCAALASCDAFQKPQSFTVTVMDGTSVVKTYEFDKGEVVSIPEGDLSRAGYEVIGLYTDAAMTEALAEGLTATADLTVYAKYQALTLYMMIDDDNGEAKTRQSVVYGATYTLEEPTREGYRFLYYTYNGEIFPMSGTYTYTNAIPITAKWERIVYINVFDGTETTKIEVPENGKVVLPDVADTADATFGGYLNGATPFATYDAESGKWVADYTGKDDLFLTYKWDVIPTYTLTVNGLEGAPVSYKTGDAYALPAAPEKSGYFFTGYTLNGEPFAAAGTYTWSENITVTATWRRQATITVYKDGAVVETVAVPKDGAYALTVPSDTATHTFGGFTSNGASFAATGIYLGETDLIIMQVFNAIPTYTLTVNGLYGDDAPAPRSYKTGDTFTLPTAPVREGYIFTGYTVNGVALTTDNGVATFTWSESTTVTANWKARVFITVYDELTRTELGKVEVLDGAYDLSGFVPAEADRIVQDADTTYTYAGLVCNGAPFAVTGSAYAGGSVTVTLDWEGVDRIYLHVVSKGVSYTFAIGEVVDGRYTPLATPRLEGYFFLGFFTDEACTVAFDNSGEYAGATDLTVYAAWRRQATITVYKDGVVVETVAVPESGAYALTVPSDTATHTFGGFISNGASFAVTGTYLGEADLIVTQVFNAIPTYTLTVNGLYGDDALAPHSYKTGDTFTLPTAPVREGYIFIGYTVDGVALTTDNGVATFTWSAHTTVTANWRERIYVTIYDGATALPNKIEIEANGTAVLPAPTETDTAKVFNGYLIAGATVVKNADGSYTVSGLTANTAASIVWYVLPVVSFDAADGAMPAGSTTVILKPGSNLLPVPTRDGYIFDGWYFGDVKIADADGACLFSVDAYASGTTLRLVAKWTSTDEVGEVAGKEYFKEKQDGEYVYVFLTRGDSAYTMEGKTLTLTENDGVATLNAAGNGFVVNKAGTFRLTITSADGSTRTVRCKAERKVTAFASDKKTDDNYAKNFQNGISSVIDAGYTNLIPHISVNAYLGKNILAATHDAIPLSITVEKKDGDVYEAVDYTYEDGAFSFDASLVGAQIRITLAPRYALGAELAAQTVAFEYRLNAGVNVYTSAELFAAFGNTAVSEINIMREIKAELDPSQCLNGNPAYPLNENAENGIYVRVPTDNDEITINGNCYMIDASSIALFDPLNGGLHRDGYCAESSYYYINAHSGVFTYHAEKLDASENAAIHVSDLYIHGNFDFSADAVSNVLGSDMQLLKGSQTYNGIVVRHAHLTLENARIDQTNVAIQTWGYDDLGHVSGLEGYVPGTPDKLYTSVKADGIQIDNTFAQSVYVWGQVGVEVSSSTIGQSSGAAFHFSDTPISADCTEYAGYLKISSDTVIKNYVSGTEPWFVAFNVANQVSPLKQALYYYCGGINIDKNLDGKTCFNFIVCVDAANGYFGDLDATVGEDNYPEENPMKIPYYEITLTGEGGSAPVNTNTVTEGVAGCDKVYYLSNSAISSTLSLLLEVIE